MGKISVNYEISKLVNQAQQQAKSEVHYELYTMVKDLEDKGIEPDIILKEVKAYLLGNKRNEMLFDV